MEENKDKEREREQEREWKKKVQYQCIQAEACATYGETSLFI